MLVEERRMLKKWIETGIDDSVPLSVKDAFYIVHHPFYSDFSDNLKNWARATLALQLDAEIQNIKTKINIKE